MCRRRWRPNSSRKSSRDRPAGLTACSLAFSRQNPVTWGPATLHVLRRPAFLPAIPTKVLELALWRFREQISDLDQKDLVTMGEGNTPVATSCALGKALGVSQLYFKLESSNPTGSYKDRFASTAVSYMRKRGQKLCLATSSGNAGAALAAYCARARISLQVIILEDTVGGKLRQMLAYGAELIRVKGFCTDPKATTAIVDHLKRRCQRDNATLQISNFKFAPEGMAGVQSLGLEIASEVPHVKHVFIPAGGGGLALGTARGLRRAAEQKTMPCMPAVHIVQPEGVATIAGPLARGSDKAAAVVCTSKISGLQVGEVFDGDLTIQAAKQSHGTGFTPSDEQILQWQQRLVLEEGIFCEPAGAAALAGLAEAVHQQRIRPDEPVVCLVTGSGFKDPDSIEAMTDLGEVPTLETADFLAT